MLLSSGTVPMRGVLAQTNPTWQALPLVPNRNLQLVWDLGFLTEAHPGGGSTPHDSLVVAFGDFVMQYAPGELNGPDGMFGDWRVHCGFYDICRPRELLITRAGTVMSSGTNRFGRGAPRGRHWDNSVAGAGGGAVLLQPGFSLGGQPADCIYSLPAYRAQRSCGDGADSTWTRLLPTPEDGLALAALPPSAQLPQGRLIGGFYNGVAFSDDAGETWQPTSLGNRWVVRVLAAVPDGAHPYGGPLFAGANDLDRYFQPDAEVLHRSDDGGTTWQFVHRFHADDLHLPSPLEFAALTATPDGALWAGIANLRGGPSPWPGRILRSTDGGATWARADDGFCCMTGTDQGYAVRQFALHRDGRLFAATEWGVWHTAAPVVLPVGTAAPHAPPPGLDLVVVPNPARGAAEARVEAPAALAHAVVEVLDARGRRVARLHDGPLPAGASVWAVQTAGWAAGRYTVRAQGAAGAVTAPLTVTR